MFQKMSSKKNGLIAIIILICCLLPFIVFSLSTNKMSYNVEKMSEEHYYKISIRGNQGEIIYEGDYKVSPQMNVIGKNTMIVTVGAGDAQSSIFINGKMGKVSDAYDVIAACNEKLVVYGTYEDGQMKIIIRDIYDKGKCYKEITDMFPDTAVGHYLIKDAQIINNHLVHLTYYVDDWKEKERLVFLW